MTSLICILAVFMLSAAPTVTKPKVNAPAKRHLRDRVPSYLNDVDYSHPERMVNRA